MGYFMGKASKWNTISLSHQWKELSHISHFIEREVRKCNELDTHIYPITMEEMEKSFGESLAVSAPFVVLSFFLLYGPETKSFSFLIVLFFLGSFAYAILSAFLHS